MANIVIENAEILPGRWRNFSGRPTTFNRDGGKRVFNIIFGADMAQKLTAEGYKVKEMKPREGDDAEEPRFRLEISLKYGYRPPRVVQITSDGGRVPLNETTVGVLDYARIQNADIEIRPYDYDFNGSQGRKAYLKTMYISIETSELDEKYGYFDMEEPAPEEDF